MAQRSAPETSSFPCTSPPLWVLLSVGARVMSDLRRYAAATATPPKSTTRPTTTSSTPGNGCCVRSQLSPTRRLAPCSPRLTRQTGLLGDLETIPIPANYLEAIKGVGQVANQLLQIGQKDLDPESKLLPPDGNTILHIVGAFIFEAINNYREGYRPAMQQPYNPNAAHTDANALANAWAPVLGSKRARPRRSRLR